MDTILVYVTTADKAEAEAIATSLIERKLIACANIIGGITSLYRWEDRLQRAEECLLLAKTQAAKQAEVIAAMREIHSYDTPCITVLPIAGGDEAFLQWVRLETD